MTEVCTAMDECRDACQPGEDDRVEGREGGWV